MNDNLTPAEELLRALAPWRRTDLITHLLDLAVFFAIHTDVPVPDYGVLTIPALGDGPDERASNVQATAVALGVITTDGDGWLRATRQWGTLTVETRTPARKAAQAA